MVDRTYRTRTLGVAAAGVPDQYADGKAAKVWEYYIGGSRNRTEQYREFMCSLLRSKGVKNICDVACGNGYPVKCRTSYSETIKGCFPSPKKGNMVATPSPIKLKGLIKKEFYGIVDSILFVENGFKVTSFDASDKMLKYALKTRWERRKEQAFDEWVIEEANWLDLAENHGNVEFPQGGFDCVICLGNSFAHLPDLTGDQENHRIAIRNFHEILKPGGLLIIDHRNYDAILDCGKAPHRNVYYNSDRIIDIKTSILHVNGEPAMITLDYIVDGTAEKKIQSGATEKDLSKFRLSYYPHRLEKFDQLLEGVFGKDTEHVVWGDFKPKGEIEVPAYFIHLIQKKST